MSYVEQGGLTNQRPSVLVLAGEWFTSSKCPRQESNLRTWLRRPMLYPLSYEGGAFSLLRPTGNTSCALYLTALLGWLFHAVRGNIESERSSVIQRRCFSRRLEGDYSCEIGRPPWWSMAGGCISKGVSC
jgi:hypothetical protein